MLPLNFHVHDVSRKKKRQEQFNEDNPAVQNMAEQWDLLYIVLQNSGTSQWPKSG